MANLINQNKQPDDFVSNVEYMEVINAINTLNTLLGTVTNTLNTIQLKQDSFKPTKGTGLSVNLSGGVAKRISDGVLLNLAAQTVFIPANVTNAWIYLDRAGVGRVGALPEESMEIAQVTTNGSTVLTIIDQRSASFSITQRVPRKIVHAAKTGNQNITAGGGYNIISGWQTTDTSYQMNEGGILSGGGVLTIPRSTQYSIFCRVLYESTIPTNLSAKLSLFVGEEELRILDEVPTQANALRCVLQGTHYDRFTEGQVLTLRASVGNGSGVFLSGTKNTEWIISSLA